ncbi:MAG TPA: UPF0182 family protein, partial [Marmoricola sp.]
HFRYPEDLFKVQRDILADYHVTSPSTFFADSDKWVVPDDPSSDSERRQPPYRLPVALTPGAKPVYSLTSVYTPYLKQNLSAFISVDSDATSADYGQLNILRLPDRPPTPGPENIANNFVSNPEVAERLRNYRNQSGRVRNGNLLTLPVGGGLLYVEPVYTLRSTGSGSYPTIAFVTASFGKQVGVGNTLSQALSEIVGAGHASGSKAHQGASKASGTGSANPGGGGSQAGAKAGSSAPSAQVWALLHKADAKFAAADRALKAQDLARYSKLIDQARAYLERAIALQSSSGAGGSTTGSGKS